MQHGCLGSASLVRGACWALAKLGQKLQLKHDWRGSPNLCDNTPKSTLEVRIKGSLLYGKHTLKPSWLIEGPGGRGKRNCCPYHGSAAATVAVHVQGTITEVRGVSRV